MAILWRYTSGNNGDIVVFDRANATDSFKFKANITGQAGINGGMNGAEIIMPLKYLSNFCRIPEMFLFNCEININLTWSANCVIVYTNVANQNPTSEITETKFYVVVATLSI